MKTRKTAISKDQYFTSPKAAADIVDWLTSKRWIVGVNTIVEPCAGSKELVNAIQYKFPNIEFIMVDLYPK